MTPTFLTTPILQEFIHYMSTIVNISSKPKKLTEEDIEHIFKVFDLDGTGEINIEEFQQVFHRLGNPMTVQELNSFIRELDEDHNGTISLEEFVKFMERYAAE